MANILFGQDWAEVAEAKSTAVSDDAKGEEKTKIGFKLYHLNVENNSIYFLMPDLKKLKGDAINSLVAMLFESLKNT